MKHDLVAWRPTMLAAAFGVVVTGVVVATPYLTFGFPSPSLHLALDSVDACIALLVAYLLYGRYVRFHRLQDALLCAGLLMLFVASIGLAYLIDAVPDSTRGTLDVWLPLAVRVMGGGLVAASALAGDRQLRTRLVGLPVAVAALAVAVTGAVLWSFDDSLPLALDVTQTPVSAQHPLLIGHPLLLAGQVIAAACFFVAAVLFTRAASRSSDELLRWVGPAFALAGFARVNYVLFPSLYTDWVYTGDVLRTGFYILLLIGAAREIRQFWRAEAEIAVLEDRRRLARELHDGVLQELAYIKAETRAMPESPPRTAVLNACERALDEARAAVHALGAPADEPLSHTLARAVGQLVERYGVQLELDLDDRIRVAPDQTHALTRIAREAVSNAVRHGRASTVRLLLRQEAGRRLLVISDDGRGFVVADAGHGSGGGSGGGSGYGLTSMRDRARGLPGTFAISSVIGDGAVLTVVW